MNSDATEQHREARVNRNADGDPLGVGLVLSTDELRALGVDVGHVERVVYGVEDGELRVHEPVRGSLHL